MRIQLYFRILLSLFVLISLNSMGQQMPHFSQYMFNDFFLNPAIAGTKEKTEVKLTLRNQWSNFEESPKTQTFGFNTNYFDNMGLGAIILNDKTGPLNQTGLEIAYAYHLQLDDNSKLSLGLSAKAVQYVLNVSKLELEDPNDNTILFGNSEDKSMVPDASFGAYYYSDKLFAGISIPQLFQTSIRYDGSAGRINKEVRHYYLYGGYSFAINEDFEVQPSLLIKTILKAPTQLDFNVKATYKNLFWLGTSYRHKESSIVMLGLKWEKISIGYAYDYSITNIRKYSSGSHEIMLGLDIETKDLKPSVSRFK